MSLQNGVLGAFGLDFGGLGPPFWRVRASFSKALDVIFGTTNAKNAQKTAKTKAPSQGGQTAKGWVGGGDPPGGVQWNWNQVSHFGLYKLPCLPILTLLS